MGKKTNSYSKDPHCARQTMLLQTSFKMMSKIKPKFGLANCLGGLQGVFRGGRGKKKKNSIIPDSFPICK